MPDFIPATPSKRVQDITGKKVGRLTAIRYVGYCVFKSTRLSVWEFKCDCGNTSITYANHISTGHVKSCGCASDEYFKRGLVNPPKTQKEMYRKHRAKRLAAVREYRIRNAAKLAAWYQKNKDYYRIKAAERRAKIRGCSVDPKGLWHWVRRMKRQTGLTCYYCGMSIPKGKLELDHVIPLVKGGQHSAANMAASCEHCNATKSSKLPSEWQREGQQFLSL